jgi:hypothetical protein
MDFPCNRCDVLVRPWELGSGDDAVCPYCGAESVVRVFPAMFHKQSGAVSSPAEEGEATCFDHATRRAAAHCTQCGRFVCQLCSVEFRGGVWCPHCFAAGFTKKASPDLQQGRTLYDSLAFTLALAPLLVWPFTIVTAPAAIFIAVFFWRKPISVVRKYRWRMLAAIILGVAQIAGWIWVILYLVNLPRGQS